MGPKAGKAREEAILVLAPTGRDAALAAAVLAEHHLHAVVCRDIEALCAEIDVGAGAALLTEEALMGPEAPHFAEALGRQPPWSDLPVLVFSGGDPSDVAGRRTLAAIAPFGNVTLLDRPIRIIALVSALRAALRARHRQYEVRDLVARLERSVEERDRFLAMLGHELRNPLAVIVFGLQVLDQAGGADPRLRRHFEAIARQSRLLTRLVDDLLDVSRVTSGRVHLSRARVDLIELVKRCVDEAGAVIAAHGLELELAAEPGPIVVEGDAVRLDQVVNNLLTNAGKYTPRSGRVRVSVGRSGDRAVIAVEDTGVGIAKEMLGRVFEPFTQVEGSLDRAHGGLGLGLSVVRGLVELHGGTVLASSPGLGQGSRFTVTLPLAAAAPELPAPIAPSAPPRPALRLVLVEDNDDVREGLQALLEMSGHRMVGVAVDGPSGVAAVLAGAPDGALVDIGLPGFDGFEVARSLRAALGDRVFLVALSGYGQPEDKLRAREAGFDAHLSKPIEIGALEAVLRELGSRR